MYLFQPLEERLRLRQLVPCCEGAWYWPMCFSGIYESSARCLPTEAKEMAERGQREQGRILRNPRRSSESSVSDLHGKSVFSLVSFKGSKERTVGNSSSGEIPKKQKTPAVRGQWASAGAEKKPCFFCNLIIWFKINPFPLWTDSPLVSDFPRKLQCECHPACFMDSKTNRFLHACLWSRSGSFSFWKWPPFNCP